MTRLVLWFVLLAPVATGCMQTRHVEASSVTSCDCGTVGRDAAYSERNWCGLWLGQPARVQP